MKSILQRLDELEARGDELADLPGAGLPSRTHEVAVEVMFELITMGNLFAQAGGRDSGVPTMLSAMIHTLERSRPILVESIAKVPEPAIQQFMRELGAKVARIYEVEPARDDDDGADTDRAEPAAS